MLGIKKGHEYNTDILIIGSGCAGLLCALHLPKDKKVTVITKRNVERSDSFLAQGGMCVLDDMSDYDAYFEDTLKAGHYENDKGSVDIMLKKSKELCEELLSLGVRFKTKADGSLDFTREGGHSKPRIVFYKDITGREITEKLWAEVLKRPNIEIIEYQKMVDLLIKDNCCYGAVIKDNSERAVPKIPDEKLAQNLRYSDNGVVVNDVKGSINSTYMDVRADETGIESEFEEITVVRSDFTVLATGGVGGLFDQSTNFRNLTGDSLALSLKYGIELKDINYIQIHPTTFYTEDVEDRNFLISESVRGEGAILLNKNGERFVDELLPRDVLTGKILEQMKKDGTKHVWEDLRTIPREELVSHFPNIVEHCRQRGYDVTKEPIPVVPAQHYFMGGIKVDYVGSTSCDSLYAIGETACNGVHGKNRLASNSLLESMVWAKLAAADITSKYIENKTLDMAESVETGSENTDGGLNNKDCNAFANIDLSFYKDGEALDKHYRKIVLDAIKEADEKMAKESNN